MDLFNFLILVSLFCGIRGEFGGVKEQKKIAFGPQLGNNFGGTSGEATITPPITVDDEKFDDNELKKLFIRNFPWYYNLNKKNKDLIPLRSDDFSQNEDATPKISKSDEKLDQINKLNNSRSSFRKVRQSQENEGPTYNLKCYECDGSFGSHEEKSCYDGTVKTTKRCEEAAQCYVELHPQYIRRGCLLPDKINRTFVCKCPLCNSNPSWDYSYYTYQNIRDWQFDNHFLQTPVQDISLFCKYCNTETHNYYNETTIDKCKGGVDAPYTTCKRNSACYTNIDDETGKVSRGCITLPVYNSIYFFCNKSLCNSEYFDNPTTRRNAEYPIMQRLYHNVKPMQNMELVVDQKSIQLNTSWRNNENFWVLVISVVVSSRS